MAYYKLNQAIHTAIVALADNGALSEVHARLIERNIRRAGVNNVIEGMKRPMTADFGLYWSINTATVADLVTQDLDA